MRVITVTVLGGGSAQARLLSLLIALRGLLRLVGIDLRIKSIVTVADDGGSTGEIRRRFGGPSLGDIVNVMAAVARNRDFAETIMLRYPKSAGPGLAGHKIGNLILDRRRTLEGGLPAAIAMLSEALNCEAEIYPSSLDSPDLCIRLSNGTEICGEHYLDKPEHDGNLEIVDFWLSPNATINPEARAAIMEADKIIISAGDPHGSIGACIKVDGVPEAMAASGAAIGTVVPLFNRYGQSTNWAAVDHVRFQQGLVSPARISAAFFDITKPSLGLVKLYHAEHENKVPEGNLRDLEREGVLIFRGEYLEESQEERQDGDEIRRSTLLARHGEAIIPDIRTFLLS